MSVTWREPSSFSRKGSAMRPAKRRILLALLAAVLLPVSGCQSLYTGLGVETYWNEKKLRERNWWAAKHAWNSRFQCFTNQPHIRDFAKGFRAGYTCSRRRWYWQLLPSPNISQRSAPVRSARLAGSRLSRHLSGSCRCGSKSIHFDARYQRAKWVPDTGRILVAKRISF